jgi:signal transduction histidine kinase
VTGFDGPDAGVLLQLLEAARGVMSDLDLEAVLRRLLDAACEVCGARYAALGLLDSGGNRLERFVTAGLDEDARRRIGAPPHGRGVLGELIERPAPLRLREVSAHPHSYGFPPEHPPMHSFLGAPVFLDGTALGNLYLTEKVGAAEFTDSDERALVLLAGFAGVAIDHARRFAALQGQRRDLERSVAALDATVQIARAVGGETDLGVILELVAKRGRALVSARTLVIELARGGDMFIGAGAGELPSELVGRTVDGTNSLASLALRRSTTLRIEDEPNLRRFRQHGLGRFGVAAQAGLVVPLVFRGLALGVLIAVDRLEDGPAFSEDDQRLLEAFAASAATAVATARSVEADRRSQRISAAEQERARWARELHDETLQNLAAMRLSISAQLRAGDLSTVRTTLLEALESIDGEIRSLRSLIHELRPTVLDDLGLGAALEDLVARVSSREPEIELGLDCAYAHAGERSPAAADIETAIYRIVQEAVTNAIKHGNAGRATISVRHEDRAVTVVVWDDGSGFDPAAPASGFGLTSMRERAELVGGTLAITSVRGAGTTVTATIPESDGAVRRAVAS